MHTAVKHPSSRRNLLRRRTFPRCKVGLVASTCQASLFPGNTVLLNLLCSVYHVFLESNLKYSGRAFI